MKTLFRGICIGLPAICMGCTTITTSAIKTTGAVAKTTIETGAKVARTTVGTSVDLAGFVFHKSVVTVIDTSTGLSHKVPWKEGLNASRAAEVAAIKRGGKVIEIIRGTQKIGAEANTILKPGDLVQLGDQ
jgi:hypothetical protein|tara:strand:- start:1455 stop:1847 length:393 start_codon:yes stop_codon:yes gene_type:complete